MVPTAAGEAAGNAARGELKDGVKAWLRASIWLVAFISACAVFIAVRDRPLFVSVLGIFAVLGAARRLHEVVRRSLADDRFRGLARWVWLLWLPVAGGALVVVWWIGRANGWGFFGAALLYLGLGLIVEQVRRSLDWSRRWGPRVVGGCAALGLTGLLIMAVAGLGLAWALVVVAAVFAPVGLNLLSEVLLDRLTDLSSPLMWVLPAVGLVLFGGGLLLVALDVNDAYVVLFGATVFVLMLAVAARSNTDVLFVVAMAAVVWALSHRSVPMPESATVRPDATAIVALGDSYISGEGAEQFYEGTNAKGDNECRRAPTAYPVSLIEEEHPAIPERLRLVFLACSGADARGVREQLAQFQDLRAQVDFDVRFVLLSVGGNDALFGSVARTCLLPGDCSELGPAWTDNLAELRRGLDGLYEEVGETFDDVPVLVVPYPVPISEQRCSSSGFTADEHVFLHDFTLALDDILRQAAANARFHYVDTMPNALAQADARLCDAAPGDVGVNFLAANSVIGTLEQASYPLNWFHNSLHPNLLGHNLMRGAVVQWLDRNPTLDVRVESSPAADGESSDDSDGTERKGPCRGRYGDDLKTCTERWTTEQIGRAALAEGWIALAVALGAWIIVLPLIRLWRQVFTD